MEFYKKRKLEVKRKKEKVEDLFNNIVEPAPLTKKTLEKEVILSLRPVTSGVMILKARS
jgi:hypothetical protein